MIKKNNINIMKNLPDLTRKILHERGIHVKDIAEIVYILQKDYVDGLSIDDCIYSVNKVLDKREVCNAILTGISLDVAAENNALEEPILTIIKNDEGLYGVDEVMALAIVNIYGSIGFTNFGYLDKEKIGVIGKLDKDGKNVNTFLDDLIAAVAAAAAARIAHTEVDND